MRTNILDVVCAVLLTIGAINWGLVGLVGISVVEAAFDPIFQPAAAEIVIRTIYVVIGLAGVYYVYPLYKMAGEYRRRSQTAT